jgi:DNA-binding Lrp family transcriptional regulator
MDKLDVAILRALFQGEFGAPMRGDLTLTSTAIAKKLEVGDQTVRDRVKRMMDSGFLKAPPLFLNPEILGRKVGALSFDIPAAANRTEIVQRLALMDGIVVVMSHVGGLLGVVFYYDETSMGRRIGFISRLVGVDKYTFTQVPFPHFRLRLSKTDWKIIIGLKANTDRSYNGLAKELGLSGRTVKRRLDRLIEGGAVYAFPAADPKFLKQAVLASLVVDYPPSAAREEVDRRLVAEFDDSLFFAGLWTTYSVLALILPSVQASREAVERAMRVEGVEKARIDIVEDRIESQYVPSRAPAGRTVVDAGFG